MRPSYSPRTVQYIGGAAENMQFDRKQRCHSDENAICHNTANLYTKSPRDQPICTPANHAQPPRTDNPLMKQGTWKESTKNTINKMGRRTSTSKAHLRVGYRLAALVLVDELRLLVDHLGQLQRKRCRQERGQGGCK